jgi:hypothetical protein
VLGALHRRIKAFDSHRIGARQDQGVFGVPGVERGAQLAAHLGHRHHALAVKVAAALGKGLVFELNHGRTGALEGAHRALGVQGVAKAGIGIDDHRQLHPLGDAREAVSHLGGGGQADIGAAQSGVGD